MALTWREKLGKPAGPKRTRLERPFAGVPAGSVLYVSTPRELDRLLRAVPAGTTIDIAALREQLADVNDADATCPVTTSVFTQIVAEAALDEVAVGAAWDEVTPFWRAIDPDSPLARRLRCGRQLLRDRRGQDTEP
jgi:hypothetical protein